VPPYNHGTSTFFAICFPGGAKGYGQLFFFFRRIREAEPRKKGGADQRAEPAVEEEAEPGNDQQGDASSVTPRPRQMSMSACFQVGSVSHDRLRMHSFSRFVCMNCKDTAWLSGLPIQCRSVPRPSGR